MDRNLEDLQDKYLKTLKAFKKWMVDVKCLRDTQKEYFKTRKTSTLQESKELEKEIDAKTDSWIQRINDEIESYEGKKTLF